MSSLYYRKSRLFSVTLGAVDRTKLEATQQHLDVIDIIVHPDYVKNILIEGSSDLALLRLARKATIVPGAVEVVSLIASTEGDTNLWETGDVQCSINGFGLTYYGDSGMYSDVRRSINITGTLVKHCDEILFPMTFKMSVKKQICSHSMWETTCVGDEGSPLICPDSEGTGVLIGLVQFSTCRKSSIVMYTRLAHFLPWIRDHF